MTERDVSRSRLSRRRFLRGGASALAATALSARDASAVPRPSTDPDTVVNVADLGAVGDGRTDDTEAFETAYTFAAARVSGGVGRVVVEIPAGEFLITRPHALLNGVAPPRPASGLRFSGAGRRMTSLVFRPGTGPGSFLCRNEDVWSNLSFERMQFRSTTPGASFFDSYSTGQAQDYRFSECEWMGEWEYGLVLSGTDTNSEMRWEACRVGGRYRRAFLYSGLTRDGQQEPNDQDQFLNYWFTDMKVEYEWGNFLEFPYGGSIACRGGSYIITGRRPQSTPEYGTTSTFFRFPGAQHHDSVQRFHAQDIRFEVRNPDVVVIDCVWNGGTVHFSDCDDTGLAYRDFSAEVRPHRYDVGPRGPLIRYDSCQLVGRHEYRPASAPDPLPVLARYDMCLLRSHTAHDFAVTAGTGQVPFVRFVDCVDTYGPADSPVSTPSTPPAPPPCLAPSPSPASAPEPSPATTPAPQPATPPEPSPATTPATPATPTPLDTGQAGCSSPQQKPP
ncbi:glycosyl hydrolase family 28-related protein [Streptomyces sp. NPDC017673]|uniref:glycosyl hydrolase family 28-related protein n=1 Tax=unclassified Streptomyces TaxID=2593676 RepID=UPI00379BAEDF